MSADIAAVAKLTILYVAKVTKTIVALNGIFAIKASIEFDGHLCCHYRMPLSPEVIIHRPHHSSSLNRCRIKR